MTDPIASDEITNQPTMNEMDNLIQRVTDLESRQTKPRPWWRDVVTVLGVCTFAFSVATTAFSYLLATQQHQHELRIELRDISSRLAQLPREQVMFDLQNYVGVPVQQQSRQRSLALAIQNERAVLLGQALEIVRDIPDLVSSAEYFSLAGALHDTVNFGKAAQYYDEAAKRATTIAEYVSALRSKAHMEFEIKDVSQGRTSYEKALSRLRSGDNQANLGSAAYTEMMWAEGELAANNCAEFKEHIAQAVKSDDERKAKNLPGEQIDGFLSSLKPKALAAGCQ